MTLTKLAPTSVSGLQLARRLSKGMPMTITSEIAVARAANEWLHANLLPLTPEEWETRALAASGAWPRSPRTWSGARSCTPS